MLMTEIWVRIKIRSINSEIRIYDKYPDPKIRIIGFRKIRIFHITNRYSISVGDKPRQYVCDDRSRESVVGSVVKLLMLSTRFDYYQTWPMTNSNVFI